MPFRLTIEDGLVRLNLSGIVTVGDLKEIADAAEKIERESTVCPHRVSDLSEVIRLDLTFSQVWAFAEQRKMSKIPNPVKSAIVASRPDHVGVVRMFQALNNHPQITIEIFQDMNHAMKWVTAR